MDQKLNKTDASSVKTSASASDVEKTTETRVVSCPPEVGDDGNPRYWTTRKKIPIACFALLSGFVATFGTPIYIAGIPSIAIEFKVSTTLAILPVSLYAWGLGIGGLLATAASEVFGRTIVYRIAIPLALVLSVVGGSAKTYTTLAVARFFAGFCAGPCLTVGSGVINDLWDVSLEKMGSAFAVFFGILLIWATEIGPMASGSLVTWRSWHWTFWVSVMLLGIMAVAAFFISETYVPERARRRVRREKGTAETREALSHLFLVSVSRPLHMIIVEPLVFPSGLVVSVSQSVVFAYYVAYAVLFEEVYHFSQYQVGMTFAALLIGALLAVPVLALFDRLTYQKAREHAIATGTTVLPERRLYPAMLGGILFPISLFWLAWAGKPGVHWIVPVLSGIPFGLGYLLNMMSIPIYNNEVYSTHYGASVLAATTFMRFMMSSSFPLFTVQMVHSLGFNWAISLLGFVNLAMIPIPWVFLKWGPILRSRSRYLKA